MGCSESASDTVAKGAKEGAAEIVAEADAASVGEWV